MDESTAVSVGVGTLSGGAVVLAVARWLLGTLLDRLLAQFDAIVTRVGQLDVSVAQTTARLEACDERTIRVGEEVARMGARLDAVQERVRGISETHGPRLAALETAQAMRATP